MIIKTEEFEQSIIRDIQELKIDEQDFLLKGSFLTKKYNDYITDIDFSLSVSYSYNFFKQLANVLNKSKSFIFLNISLGLRRECRPPWGSEFKTFVFDEAVSWSRDISKKLNERNRQEVNRILNKIFSKGLSYTVKDFSDIAEIVKKEGILPWSTDNMMKGYIIENGVKYDIMSMVNQKIAVLKLVYKYKNDFCSVDIGLEDKRYKRYIPRKQYYLSQNWYKITKSMIKKINPEYKHIYTDILEGINELIAVKYYKKMINNFEIYQIFPWHFTVGLNESLKIESEYGKFSMNEIDNKINQYLTSNISFFDATIKHMSSEYVKEFLINLTMLYETMIPNTKRYNKIGLSVFCENNYEDIQNMLMVSKNLDRSMVKVILCCKKVSIEHEVPIKNVIILCLEYKG